jgi:ParB-like chromosome segregation protein Spo0J
MLKAIDVSKIDPSPFQIRKHRDEGKLKELGASIERDSQIEPIVVRRNGGRTIGKFSL